MRRAALHIAAAMAFALTGCKPSTAAPDAGVVDAGAAHIEVFPPPAPQEAAQLAEEAKHRPSGTRTAEKVYDAIYDAGIGLGARRQQLAGPYAAKYCLDAIGPLRISLTVCEYDSEEAALAGKKVALELNAPAANYMVMQKGTTVLTIREPHPKSTQTAEVRNRIAQAFVAL